MNEFFPRIITLLRKERGLSQKKVAEDLQVSQALLSHYEKGVRECGLDFVVRAANYYDVSCDYLLGRTPDRTGAMLTVEDIPDADTNDTDKMFRGNVMATLNKKLIANTLNVIYDLLQKSKNKHLTTELSAYLMVAVYKMFRLLYSANAKNPQGIFRVSPRLSDGLATAAMSIAQANADSLAQGEAVGELEGLEDETLLAMTPESLKQDYPYFQQSLFNLIQRAEARMEPQQEPKGKR